MLYTNVWDFNNSNQCLTKTSDYNKVIDIIRFTRQFLNFTQDTLSWFITLLQKGIPEPVFYGDLDYKFKRVVGKSNFSGQYKNIIKRYKKKLDITSISCNSLQVWSYTLSRIIAMVSPLITRRWVRPQSQ